MISCTRVERISLYELFVCLLWESMMLAALGLIIVFGRVMISSFPGLHFSAIRAWVKLINLIEKPKYKRTL